MRRFAFEKGFVTLLAGALAVCETGCSPEALVAVSGPAEKADSAAPTGGPGRIHTDGATIVDADGNAVRIAAVTWLGLESTSFAPSGLWARSLGDLLDSVVSFGFNAVRVPFSDTLFDGAATPRDVDGTLNPDLVGLDGPALLDALVAGAEARHLWVILDRHHPDAGQPSALWYSDAHPEARVLEDFRSLAVRYRDRTSVIAFELHDNVRGPATWGDGNASTDFRAAAERLGNAILEVNPDVLVLVSGIEAVPDGWNAATFGYLARARDYPVQLSVPHRVVYTTRDLPPTLAPEEWAQAKNDAANLPPLWESAWGYLMTDGLAPVMMASFGTALQEDADKAWLTAMVSSISSRRQSFAYACLNPNCGPTGGLLSDDWQNPDRAKLDALAPLLNPR